MPLANSSVGDLWCEARGSADAVGKSIEGGMLAGENRPRGADEPPGRPHGQIYWVMFAMQMLVPVGCEKMPKICKRR